MSGNRIVPSMGAVSLSCVRSRGAPLHSISLCVYWRVHNYCDKYIHSAVTLFCTTCRGRSLAIDRQTEKAKDFYNHKYIDTFWELNTIKYVHIFNIIFNTVTTFFAFICVLALSCRRVEGGVTRHVDEHVIPTDTISFTQFKWLTNLTMNFNSIYKKVL